jgi:hypothetical protein
MNRDVRAFELTPIRSVSEASSRTRLFIIILEFPPVQLEANAVEISKQLSVFLENKPGRLARVLSAFARQKVNLVALTVMDSHEHNVLRMVTDAVSETRSILKEVGTPFTETDVAVVELKHQPGALAHICETLAADHINIDYAYCSVGGKNGKTVAVFKVSNLEKLSRVLNSSPNHVPRRGLGRRLGRRPMHMRQTSG